MSTIAILFHECESNPEGYIIHQLAEIWREAGHEIKYLFGTRYHDPADLLFVHVNLSVVPRAYFEFAARYPRAVNHRIADIRKSRISQLLVGPEDDWPGPVIIKSNLNYGGHPEALLSRNWLERRSPLARRIRAATRRWLQGDTPFAKSAEYRVLDNKTEIPPAWYSARNVVIEKFLPELDEGRYRLRMHLGLGDRAVCVRLASHEPVIKAGNSTGTEDIEPHPQVAEWRRELGLDYGKIDYVVVDGEPILLDVNKTIGATAADYRSRESLRRQRVHLAEGIYSLLR